MEKSNSIKSLAAALVAFQLKVGKIRKDAKNPFFKSSYASLANIQDAICIPLTESGLAYMQFPDGEHGLSTIIMHADSGEWIQSNYTMRPVKDDPQGVGSCITYQKRYALAGALGLNIDDDDDANTATHGGKTPEQAEVYQKGKEEDNKPWLNENTPAFDGAVKKLREGTTTIDKIRLAFKVSKAIQTKLETLSKLEHAN